MARLAQLRLDRQGDWWHNPKKLPTIAAEAGLCGGQVRNFLRRWEVPESTQTIWISFHSTDTPDREPITIPWCDGIEFVDRDPVLPTYFISWRLVDVLRPFVGKTVWVQVEYAVETRNGKKPNR